MAEPKPLAVVYQDFHCRGPPVAEDENPTGKRVLFQRLFAEPGQAVDPLAKIGRLHGRHKAHLRSDLDHVSLRQKSRLNAARSGIATPLR